MMSKIYEAIEAAVAKGVPTQYIASMLISQGWPDVLVHQALDAWLRTHGRAQQKTSFKAWLKKYHRKALPSVIAVAAFSTVNIGLVLLKPWPTKIMVDSVFGPEQAPGPLARFSGSSDLILITALMTIGIFLAAAIFSTLKDYFLVELGYWLNQDIKEESLRHILHLPLYHQERLAKGDYVHRQNFVTNSMADLTLSTTVSIAEIPHDSYW